MSESIALSQVTETPRLVISIIGPHADEDAATIFSRKMTDILQVGFTFWLIRSWGAKPDQVKRIFNNSPAGYLVFVEPATIGGAVPTTEDVKASSYSVDRANWSPIPPGLGPVTGKIDNGAFALVLNQIQMVSGVSTIDLWNYSQFEAEDMPIRMVLGCSTVCAVKRDSSGHPKKMKSNHRKIVAVARIIDPFEVWLREKGCQEIIV